MGKGSKVTIGYRYHMGVHLIASHGPWDEVSEFIFGERSAWTGSVTSSQSITIDKPKLFGGDKNEGGVKGSIDAMFGEPTQAVNAYLDAKIDGPVPAYRRLMSFVFRGAGRAFMWSAMTPYFKPVWIRGTRILAGWSRGGPWYSSKAVIIGADGKKDMNPAHFIYECYTNLEWGMGYDPAELDDANFRAVADTLYAEGFGLSTIWYDQTSIEDFVDLILRHVNGTRNYDLRTGKLQIHLIRDDYDIADLPELNPSNIKKMESFQRAVWGELANEIYIKYTDRDQKDAIMGPVHNLAAIDAQSGVISVTKEYPAIRTPELAARVAARDLQSSSVPVAQVKLRCNRIAWNWRPGGVFKLNFPLLGIAGVPFRITKIDPGTIREGEIYLEGIEDIFKMPSFAYIAPVQSGWVAPDNTPAPVTAQRIVESPYWDIVRNVSPADLASFPPDYAFTEQLAVRSGTALNFEAWNAPSSGGTYTQVDDGDFCASGTLATSVSIGAAPVTVSLNDAEDLDQVEIGDYAYIDNEVFGVTAVDPGAGSVALTRGCLDTVPAAHTTGARVYFVDGTQGRDDTVRSDGETTYYKLLPRTTEGTLSLASATAAGITLAGRAQRPYPPGNLKINGSVYPGSIADDDGVVAVTWAHRDRLLQTVALVPTTTGNIGPEPGTTYNLRLYNNTTSALLQNLTGLTAAFADVPLPSGSYNVRLELESVRDGLASWQKHSHVFAFSLSSGGRITQDNKNRITQASDHRVTE